MPPRVRRSSGSLARRRHRLCDRGHEIRAQGQLWSGAERTHRRRRRAERYWKKVDDGGEGGHHQLGECCRSPIVPTGHLNPPWVELLRQLKAVGGRGRSLAGTSWYEDGVSTILTGALQFCADADAAPSEVGAYILQIDLAEPVLVRLAGKPPTQLSAGRYYYCGSAYGPGGLRARLVRHMRHGKSVHWHIDQLTERGAVTGAWIVRKGRECDLVAMLAPLPMPVPGFGNSDCACCRSHLLYSPRRNIHTR